jgi:Fe-S cluster assembly protein SufD
MPNVAQEEGVFISSFRELQKRLGRSEPAWLRRSREEAMERFAELGFPTTHQEAWKYTNLASMATIPFQPVESHDAQSALTLKDLEPMLWAGASRLVFVNGWYSQELSSGEQLPAGVTVESLAAAVSQNEEVEEYLARYADYRSHPFIALNTSSWQDGAYLRIAKGTAVEQPVHLVFVSTSSGAAVVSHPRTLIVAERDSQATVVESYFGLGSGVCFSNAVTEVALGENAVIDHYKIQIEKDRSYHLATLRATEGRGANFSSCSIALGGQLARNEVGVLLEAEGAECTLNGLYLATGSRHVDNSTTIDHAKPHGTSQEFYKGILDGRATAAFNGRIIVRKDAQKTNAMQQNKNLLLSEDAVVDTTPQLEILADDVRCTHGATIGQLDREALFYLCSRGIGQKQARSLLTYAFAGDILDRVRVAPLRARLESILHARMSEGASVQEVS